MGLQVLSGNSAVLAEYAAPNCVGSGCITSRSFMPDDIQLWAVQGELDVDASLIWDVDHSDEVIYVLGGQVEIERIDTCRTGDVIIIEAQAEGRLVAREPSRLIHFGYDGDRSESKLEVGPPEPDGHHIHVARASETPANVSQGDVVTMFYADGTCHTCRVAVLRNYAAGAYRGPSHFHSQDELIYVVEGQLQIGANSASGGQLVAIPAEHRYGLRSTAGFDFINYRSGVSRYTGDPRSESVLETSEGLTLAGIHSTVER